MISDFVSPADPTATTTSTEIGRNHNIKYSLSSIVGESEIQGGSTSSSLDSSLSLPSLRSHLLDFPTDFAQKSLLASPWAQPGFNFSTSSINFPPTSIPTQQQGQKQQQSQISYPSTVPPMGIYYQPTTPNTPSDAPKAASNPNIIFKHPQQHLAAAAAQIMHKMDLQQEQKRLPQKMNFPQPPPANHNCSVDTRLPYFKPPPSEPTPQPRQQTKSPNPDHQILTLKEVSTGGLTRKYLATNSKRKNRKHDPTFIQRCHSCNCTETPEWRRGPDGARTLCNACGLHYAKLLKKKKLLGLDLTSNQPLQNSAIKLLSHAVSSSFSSLNGVQGNTERVEKQ